MINSINNFNNPKSNNRAPYLHKDQKKISRHYNDKDTSSFNSANIQRIQSSKVSKSSNFKIYKLSCKNQNSNQINFSGGTNVPKVSIIVPVYNAEKYLKKGLESLKKQTLKNIEIICINDGSKDNSLKILQEFAVNDNRFKIIDQQNQGIGITRNNGLKQAKGEYVGFMDPDDWLDKTTCKKLYNRIKSQDSDFIAFNYKNIDEENGKVKLTRLEKPEGKHIHNFSSKKTFTWKDIKSDKFKGLSSVSWNKLFKKSFIDENNLKFTPGSIAEDQEFIIGAILNAKKISFSKKPFYNYLIRKGSATHKLSDNNFQIFNVLSELNKVVKDSGLKDEVAKEYDDYTVKLFKHAYERIPYENRNKFKQMCMEKLEPEHCKKVLGEIEQKVSQPINIQRKGSFGNRLLSKILTKKSSEG